MVNWTDKITEYQIPTLREAIEVCKGRTVLILDRKDGWDFFTDVYPLIKEAEAWQVCMSSDYGITGQQKTIVDTIKADSGKEPMLWWGSFTMKKREEWREKLDNIHEQGYYPLVIWNEISATNPQYYIDIAAENLEKIEGDARIQGDIHRLFGGDEKYDTFDYCYEHGINVVTVDNGLNLQKYIVEKFGDK